MLDDEDYRLIGEKNRELQEQLDRQQARIEALQSRQGELNEEVEEYKEIIGHLAKALGKIIFINI